MITTTHDIDFQRFEIGKNGRFKEIKEGLFRVKTTKKKTGGIWYVLVPKRRQALFYGQSYIF